MLLTNNGFMNQNIAGPKKVPVEKKIFKRPELFNKRETCGLFEQIFPFNKVSNGFLI
jgi:hypothetical protein